MLWILIGTALAKVPTKIPPDAERGEALYREHCWQCHGALALGDGPLSAALPSPPLAGLIEQEGFEQAVKLTQTGQGSMPSFSTVMDRHDTRRIFVWLSELDPQTGRHPDEAADEAAADEAAADEAEPGEQTPGEEKPSEAPLEEQTQGGGQ